VQGFAPHYDDVDVFILQVSGRKRWRAYAPLPESALPRFSSRDFVESQDDLGKAILDGVLAPGDILYLPRGTIHQAESLQSEHSLHLTLSSHQRCAWLDFMNTACQVLFRCSCFRPHDFLSTPI
jgi:bifunctional lysine-specific demethylase and histidyl-hydroxylase NO66